MNLKCRECQLVCPADAINLNNIFDSKTLGKVINVNRCIFCGLCIDACNEVAGFGGMGAINYASDLNFDIRPQNYAVKKKIFKKSLFVKHIDTGSCGTCESEINALNNPYYNMHRLGVFITPSPRFADVLLATGTFTGRMTEVFFNVLDNIPKPRFIVLAGSCAIFGGVFENGTAKRTDLKLSPLLKEIFRNENIIVAPHCPPTPFEILNVLLLIKNGGLK
jgi:Ni,Fe-hydrogenase III small subunit/NAD-dependent dihydropyrimidine dehydrogenase PreA subunit